MAIDDSGSPPGELLGYARASTGRLDDDEQFETLTAAGVSGFRVYSDVHTPGSPAPHRSGLAALLDYARTGDTVVVASIDRLGATPDDVMRTVRTLLERGLRLRSVREGLDTADPTGRTIVAILASLANLGDEAETRACAPPPQDRREFVAPHRPVATRDGSVGRPRVLDAEQIEIARRRRALGERVPTIAESLGVSRATLYRTLAQDDQAGVGQTGGTGADHTHNDQPHADRTGEGDR